MKLLPIAGDAAEALATARRLAELDSGAKIWLASDTKPEGDLAFIDCALPEVVNVASPAFKCVPARSREVSTRPLRKCPPPPRIAKVSSTLEVTLAGRPVQIRELELEPGASATLIPAARISPRQRLDFNSKHLVPSAGMMPSPCRCHASTAVRHADHPFTVREIALASLIESRRIEMTRSAPMPGRRRKSPMRAYVFEHWLPKTWPTDRPLIALNPTTSSGLISVKPLPGNGLPHDSLRSVLPDHPVLFRVASSSRGTHERRCSACQPCSNRCGSPEWSPCWLRRACRPAHHRHRLLAGQFPSSLPLLSRLSARA